MVENDKLVRDGVAGDVSLDTLLNTIFKETAKVQDLLEALSLDHDALKIVPRLDEWNSKFFSALSFFNTTQNDL